MLSFLEFLRIDSKKESQVVKKNIYVMVNSRV